MNRKYKWAVGLAAAGYAAALLTHIWLPLYVSMLIPAAIIFVAIAAGSGRARQAAAQALPDQGPANIQSVQQSMHIGQPTQAPPQPAHAASADNPPDLQTAAAQEEDPVWASVYEYIGVIEEMVISEGQKNTLDNEIVEKTLTLLTRITRLIPQLKEMNDGNMNHNIQRLVFRDLNGAINPFLKLSGEAKRQNRRLLLTGVKDINSKLSFYVESIEHKDLVELQAKVELIQQRYRTTD
ncbi:hypothetical protein MH117_19975 [Paenibacillus sp. ACRRX]|uniref:hypothetical protein n=1 Tax=Paenibacillus sp. ACRRX TaxID=2918206 RepID=UPI001EF3E85B|nr:hypothetical protein [Paenibacillus sp. ACRRX]MCG7409687.1 hypothetical protein [Paenibacillus sp. ACRRX]